MRNAGARAFGFACFIVCLAGSVGNAQVVVNEFVVDERDVGAGQIHPSTREFVELYNAGPGAVDLGGWTLVTKQIGANFPAAVAYTIPAGTSLAANDYFVIGHAGATNVDFAPTPGYGGDLFPDGNAGSGTNNNFVFELRDAGQALKDAVAVETFRDPGVANLTDDQKAFTGGGIWQQLISTTVSAPNTVNSMGRYLDGRRTGANGRDFGFLPATPGGTNAPPQAAEHVVPDVDAVAIGTALGSDYYASFVLPRVINPTTAEGINPSATAPLPAPLAGSRALIAYGETGGGNAAFSKELVQSFDIYAYIDTTALGPSSGSEATTYGIGSTDPFFATPNSAGLITSPLTSNGNTGVGWLIQRSKRNFGSGVETRTVLQLINFDDGGNSVAGGAGWTVIEQIVLTSQAAAWHRLGIDYDPATGKVTARYDDETFEFLYSAAGPGDFNADGTVDARDYVLWRKNGGTQEEYDDWVANFGSSGGDGPDLVGTFYVGYRESLGAALATSRPPTFLQYESAPSGRLSGAVPEPSTAALLAVGIALAGRRHSRRSTVD